MRRHEECISLPLSKHCRLKNTLSRWRNVTHRHFPSILCKLNILEIANIDSLFLFSFQALIVGSMGRILFLPLASKERRQHCKGRWHLTWFSVVCLFVFLAAFLLCLDFFHSSSSLLFLFCLFVPCSLTQTRLKPQCHSKGLLEREALSGEWQ